MLDKLKKYLIPIFLAIGIGFVFGLISFKKFEENINDIMTGESKKLVAFQVGVFNNLENANEKATTCNGLVINDQDMYRVYVAVVSDGEAKESVKKYYENKGIDYYIRNLEYDEDIYNEIKEYEALLMATSVEYYEEILKTMVNVYKEGENLW